MNAQAESTQYSPTLSAGQAQSENSYALSPALEAAQGSRMVRVRRAVILGALMTASFLAMPTEGHAQFGGVFDALLSVISGPIGGALSSINTITGETQTLYQKTVWPLAELNQARGFIASSIRANRTSMNKIFYAPLQSATLPGVQQFESLLHSRNTAQIAPLQNSFTNNYGAVPVATDAPPQDRMMMDMDDALGQENLKTTVASDQAQDEILATADSIENQAAVATPGSVPFLTAQARIAELRSQAYIQKMLASDLRQEAGRIAHNNALMKRSAEVTNTLSNQISGTLSR